MPSELNATHPSMTWCNFPVYAPSQERLDFLCPWGDGKVGVNADSLPELQAHWVYTPHSLVGIGLPRGAILTHSDPQVLLYVAVPDCFHPDHPGSFRKYKMPGLIAPNSSPFSEFEPPNLPRPAQKFHSGGLG